MRLQVQITTLGWKTAAILFVAFSTLYGAQAAVQHDCSHAYGSRDSACVLCSLALSSAVNVPVLIVEVVQHVVDIDIPCCCADYNFSFPSCCDSRAPPAS